jgi:hypothetical protein
MKQPTGAYTILKPFTDLDKFQKQLKHHFPKSHLPSFPKRMDGDADPSANQVRCQRLEAYFNELGQIPGFFDSPFIKDFLQPVPSGLSFSEPPKLNTPERAPDSPANTPISKSISGPEKSPGVSRFQRMGSEGRARSRVIDARPDQNSSKAFFRAIVVRNYAAGGENELTLNEGNQVTILLTTPDDTQYLVYYAGSSGYVPKVSFYMNHMHVHVLPFLKRLSSIHINL